MLTTEAWAVSCSTRSRKSLSVPKEKAEDEHLGDDEHDKERQEYFDIQLAGSHDSTTNM
jgi:hypothetical protein